MKISIIGDSCTDLTPALARVLGVSIAPLKIKVGDAVQHVDDGSLDTVQLIREMKACRTSPTTACPSPDEYAARMRECEACFVITLSSKLSGSYNAACVARDMVLEDEPGKKIAVLDSESAAAGQTLIALTLRRLIDEELEFDEIERRIRAFIAPMRTRFVLEDLSNLIKNGRISKMAGFVGTMLNLRPLMADNGHGEITCLEKIRGTANAMHRLVERVAEETASYEPDSLTLVLSYCNCPERAAALKKDFLAKCRALREVVMVPTGGISTVYAFDGGVVIAF